jgi:KipI family sensor histidine kinase inhibitor
MWPRLRPVGERALLAEFPPQIDPAISARVRALAQDASRRPDVAETVPGFRTVLLMLTEQANRTRFIRAIQEDLTRHASPPPPGRVVAVPVRYGGAYGADLAAAAQRTGRRPEEFVDLHRSGEYLVYMIGFAPGFPYLGVLPEVLRLPRRDTPRARVPAGSVAVADRLTGIYPQESPGGWHLIGWTPLRLFDPAAPVPALLAPGDRVRFDPLHDEISAPPVPPGLPAAPGPDHPALEVLAPGLLATVQDEGRRGYRRFGVPGSGPLDPAAHRLASARAGNAGAGAALEMTWPAPVLRTVEPVTCALAGPGWEPLVDGRPRAADEPLRLRPGQVLEFRREGAALWAYLAIAGGIDVPLVLGSRATYLRGGFGGLGGRALRAGDILGRREEPGGPRRLPSPAASPPGPLLVRVIPGPQETHFTEEGLHRLLHEVYTVTPQIDRTGYRLAGPSIPHAAPPEILPEGVMPGAIQVPGDGQPIVLMPDGPTTGGYPKIATVVAADLPRLAQAPPGTAVRFRAVTVAALDAER